MSDNRQSLSDLASLTSQAAQAPAAATGGDEAAPVNLSGPAPAPMPLREQIIDKQGRAYATGKRKNAVARVWVTRGAGKIFVNDKEFTEYFARPVLQMIVQQPIIASNRNGQYDVRATVSRLPDVAQAGRHARLPDGLAAPVVVSTVPVDGQAAVCALPWREGQTVLDVLYAPWPTSLCERVTAAGGRVVGGAEVLFWQATEQVELMTGQQAPIEAMRAALDAAVGPR